MLFLHSNPLKALSQTALTSTGQAFLSPEKVLEGEKLSALFLCLVAVRVFVLKGFVLARWNTLKDFESDVYPIPF